MFPEGKKTMVNKLEKGLATDAGMTGHNEKEVILL